MYSPDLWKKCSYYDLQISSQFRNPIAYNFLQCSPFCELWNKNIRICSISSALKNKNQANEINYSSEVVI